MKRFSAPKASTAAAVVAAIVAILAVMFPSLGFGQSSSSHGGSPSDVFTQSEPSSETCAPGGVNVDSLTIMPLQIEVEVPSHLLVYFSFEWSGLKTHEVGGVNPQLDGVGEVSLSRYTGNATGSFIGGTASSSFPNVDPGTHTVDVNAFVAGIGPPFPGHGPIFANLESCVLTVFVIPVAS